MTQSPARLARAPVPQAADGPPESRPLHIVYIAGWVRSGSTLLGNLLGQMQDTFFGGELCYLGLRGWRQNQLCGCGKPFRECEMWSAVISTLEGEIGEAGRGLLETIPASAMRTRSLMARLLPGRRGFPRRTEQETVVALEMLYRRVATVANARVIIDSSKAPMYGRLLEQIPGVQLTVAHLVRDPRATGFSLRRRKYDPAGKRLVPGAGVFHNGFLWLAWNLVTEVMWNRRGSGARYLRIRYEDLARNPGARLPSILHLVGLPGEAPSVSAHGEAAIRPTHSVAGNPDRLRTGSIQIRVDDEWKANGPWPQKVLTSWLTWPLLLRYGYRLWE